MPYCLNCGDKLPDGEEECPKCHQKTEKRDSTDEAEVEISETLPVKKSARKIWLIVSAVILVAAVSLVLLFTVFLPGSEPLIRQIKATSHLHKITLIHIANIILKTTMFF